MLLNMSETACSTINVGILVILIFLIYMYFNGNKTHQSQKPKVFINGLGSSFPQHEYVQDQMKNVFIENYCGGKENLLEPDRDFINRIFSRTLIEKCYINLPPNRLFEQMKRQDYTTYIKDTLLSLACEAAQKAMQNADLRSCDITHIVFGTMTASIRAPSLDIHIIRQLKLNETVKRLNVEAMGCLTGFRLTGLCNDIATENENNIVLLVVCDIRSALGNQLTPFKPMEPIDKSNVIISAMFRDAGGAAIFSQKRRSNTDLCVLEHRSFLVPNSLDRVLLQEFNDGAIHLFLHKELGDALFGVLPNFIEGFLSDKNIDITTCLFALHTGGPKIIRGVTNCLNLQTEQLFGTWYVMKNFGNLSGSSNLVVLDHIMRHRQLDYSHKIHDIILPSDFSKYKYIIGLSFGPGLGVECVIFQR